MPKLGFTARATRISIAALAMITTALIVLGSACSSDDGPSGPGEEIIHKADCAGCHTDEEMLVATASPDTLPPPEDEGEG